jgi:hypothetical protein
MPNVPAETVWTLLLPITWISPHYAMIVKMPVALTRVTMNVLDAMKVIAPMIVVMK